MTPRQDILAIDLGIGRCRAACRGGVQARRVPRSRCPAPKNSSLAPRRDPRRRAPDPPARVQRGGRRSASWRKSNTMSAQPAARTAFSGASGSRTATGIARPLNRRRMSLQISSRSHPSCLLPPNAPFASSQHAATGALAHRALPARSSSSGVFRTGDSTMWICIAAAAPGCRQCDPPPSFRRIGAHRHQRRRVILASPPSRLSAPGTGWRHLHVNGALPSQAARQRQDRISAPTPRSGRSRTGASAPLRRGVEGRDERRRRSILRQRSAFLTAPCTTAGYPRARQDVCASTPRHRSQSSACFARTSKDGPASGATRNRETDPVVATQRPRPGRRSRVAEPSISQIAVGVSRPESLLRSPAS